MEVYRVASRCATGRMPGAVGETVKTDMLFIRSHALVPNHAIFYSYTTSPCTILR
jgi:hypothetical protein